MAGKSAILKILTLNCREAAELVSATEDKRISRAERLALRLHLLICAPCRRYRRALHKLRQVTKAAMEQLESVGQLPGTQLSDEARNRLRRAVDTAQGTSGEPAQ